MIKTWEDITPYNVWKVIGSYNRLTTYNLIAIAYVLLTQKKSVITNIVRTTTVLVAVCVGFATLIAPKDAIKDLYTRVIPIINGVPYNATIIHIHNAVIHFLPAFLLGLPPLYDYKSILIGYVIFYGYYFMIRWNNAIHNLYIPTIPLHVYDKITIASGIIVCMMLYVLKW
jgi:hypothetical protein